MLVHETNDRQHVIISLLVLFVYMWSNYVLHICSKKNIKKDTKDKLT